MDGLAGGMNGLESDMNRYMNGLAGGVNDLDSGMNSYINGLCEDANGLDISKIGFMMAWSSVERERRWRTRKTYLVV